MTGVPFGGARQAAWGDRGPAADLGCDLVFVHQGFQMCISRGRRQKCSFFSLDQ